MFVCPGGLNRRSWHCGPWDCFCDIGEVYPLSNHDVSPCILIQFRFYELVSNKHLSSFVPASYVLLLTDPQHKLTHLKIGNDLKIEGAVSMSEVTMDLEVLAVNYTWSIVGFRSKLYRVLWLEYS